MTHKLFLLLIALISFQVAYAQEDAPPPAEETGPALEEVDLAYSVNRLEGKGADGATVVGIRGVLFRDKADNFTASIGEFSAEIDLNGRDVSAGAIEAALQRFELEMMGAVFRDTGKQLRAYSIDLAVLKVEQHNVSPDLAISQTLGADMGAGMGVNGFGGRARLVIKGHAGFGYSHITMREAKSAIQKAILEQHPGCVNCAVPDGVNSMHASDPNNPIANFGWGLDGELFGGDVIASFSRDWVDVSSDQGWTPSMLGDENRDIYFDSSVRRTNLRVDFDLSVFKGIPKRKLYGFARWEQADGKVGYRQVSRPEDTYNTTPIHLNNVRYPRSNRVTVGVSIHVGKN